MTVYIYLFDNYDMFYDKVWFCCFPQRHSCHAITTFFKRSAYIFMFNKTNGMVLFHHFSRLFKFFLSILMQFFAKSYLHMSTLYTLIISNEIKFECLNSVQLQPSGTLSAPYFHYGMCTRTRGNT